MTTRMTLATKVEGRSSKVEAAPSTFHLPPSTSLGCLLAVLAFLSSPALAKKPATFRYSPPSRSFTCEVPEGWSAFEEEEPWGFAAHFLGPDDPSGVYRTGIDVHFFEKGQPGFVPAKKMIERLRRPQRDTDRGATPVHIIMGAAGLARTFEVTETRRLPLGQTPSLEYHLRTFVAMIANGDNYWILRLSATRETFDDSRNDFLSFLKNFRPSLVP